MNSYELMIKTNHYLIKGGTLTDNQKQNIVRQLLSAQSTTEQAQKFYKGVRYPNNNVDGRQMYPIFFIPPFNDGKKYKTIYNQIPKTHILSSNMYELEIIRLLHLLAPNVPIVKDMVEKTLERLKTTCFGNESDGIGECFDTSLIVLRFLGTVAPEETKWILERIDNFHAHYNEKKRVWQPKWYFGLCLSEIPFELAMIEILQYKEWIISQLNRSYVMNSEHDKTIHPILLYALRNVMVRLPEYEYIKEREPYVSDKDGRLYFDMKI